MTLARTAVAASSRPPEAAGASRLDHQLDRLGALIAELHREDGAAATAVPGLYLSRLSTPHAVRHTVDRAVFCVVAQGAKRILLDAEQYVYDRSTYLVVSLDLPIVGQIVEATPDRPFLGVSLELDFAELGALSVEAGLPVRPDLAPPRSVVVSRLDEELLDPTLRLVALLRRPEQVPVLAPLIRREIFYKLLLSPQSGLLRRMTAGNPQVRRIEAGVEWLKRHATRPVRMEDLARELHMSPSTMHTWFKAVTGLTPLQFQKQLRLQEARRILLSDHADAATAARRVGYESPSQFSREYRRMFGAPPLRDVERIRAGEGGLEPA